MADMDVAIQVQNLSKRFNVYAHAKDMLIEFLLRTNRHQESGPQ